MNQIASRSLTLLAARWLLGAVFIVLGTMKALDPVGFLKLAREFDLLHPAWVLNAVAAVLPWFEVFCGLLLLLGWKARAAAFVQGIALIAFTLAIAWRAWTLRQQTGVAWCALRFDCGCGTGEVAVCAKLLENVGLLALAAFVAFGDRASRAPRSPH